VSALIERLRAEGEKRYHDGHRYHVLMHEGRLTREQLQQWVLNRYYYQTRIPIKDALILSKSEDPKFRRMWIRRIRDHDGDAEGEGGLAMWLRLADGVGLDRDEVASCRFVLRGVRAACDSYVELVRSRSLLEAGRVVSTEFFAPDLMAKRVLAVGEALSVGRFGHAHLLPCARDARASGRLRGGCLRRASRDDAGSAGPLRAGAHR
jgi:pyrroloquinoline-quinone synthase